MTALVQTLRRHGPAPLALTPGQRRLGAVTLLAAAVAAQPALWPEVAEALSEAYLAVGVFVAATLLVVHGTERAVGGDLGLWLQRYRRWQVPVAALLGALPGCGGAIIAITQFSRGHLSFGAVVATLTATMGDAMFLLLAAQPATALAIAVMGVVVGWISGTLIDRLHGPDFLRPQSAPCSAKAVPAARAPLSTAERLWITLTLPALAAGLAGAFQIDVDEALDGLGLPFPPAATLGAAGALLALAMWVREGEPDAHAPRPLLKSAIATTNFVTAWVVFAFVGYVLLVGATGIDPGAAFAVWAPLVPAVAVLVGLIPGCGPQLLVTSFYLSGALPLSAQLANAISNDGDALLPILATAPRAALLATLYGAVPALLVGYGWYALFE